MQDIERFLNEKRRYRSKSYFVKNEKKGKRSFFDKLYLQFMVAAAILVLVFAFRLFPLSKPVFDRVQETVSQNYFQDVIEVFKPNED